MKKSFITVTDMFCGCGGSSQGAVAASCEVRMAANHWDLAIQTHNTNFPNIDHDCADIAQVVPARWPTTDILWASPECTNHSTASGRRRHQAQLDMFNADPEAPSVVRSRATMWDPPRFAEYHDYRLIIVENVIEVRKWRLWDAWLHAMRCLDYEYHICYFNSQFFGVPQSRDRFYAVFWKKGLPAPDLEFRPRAYCERCAVEVEAVQSWKKPANPWGRYERQYIYCCPRCGSKVEPYMTPALVAIDWSDVGTRIGDRNKPLKAKTMQRIERGLEQYGNRYLVIDTSYAGGLRAVPVDGPLPTQTARQSLAMLTPWLTSTVGFQPGCSVDKPMPTQTTCQSQALTIPPSAIIVLRQGADAESPGTPLTTITAGGINHGLLRMPVVVVNYSPGYCKPATDPLASITSVDHHALVLPEPFLTSYYNADSGHPVDEPMGTISTVDRHGLVMPEPFVMSYYSRNDATGPVSNPLGTVTVEPRHALVQPENPTVEDCYFRMLRPDEIKLGMAFGRDYVVLGNNRDQVRQCGNAVTPPVAEWLFSRCMAVFE